MRIKYERCADTNADTICTADYRLEINYKNEAEINRISETPMDSAGPEPAQMRMRRVPARIFLTSIALAVIAPLLVIGPACGKYIQNLPSPPPVRLENSNVYSASVMSSH